jgi:gluconokinase
MTVLVLDIGSSSVRALLFDDQARLIPGAVVSAAHEITTEPPGAATLDMPGLQARVEHCIDQILTHPAAGQIRVVGVDTLVGNMLGVRADGQPLTPVYTYADTRSAPDVDQLAAHVSPQQKHQDTGCLLHTAYQPARLHWLRRTQPDLFQQVARWVDLGYVLYQQWFGEGRTSYSVASWSGLLNRATLTWDADWLRILDISSARLPELGDDQQVVSGLTPAYAARWPALKSTPFCLPVGDGAAANVGCGCIDRTQMTLTVGTTAALRVMTDALLPPVPQGLWSYRVDARHHLIGGATSEGGNIFQWARGTLALGSREEVEAALAARTPDEHHLTMLPLLAGERSPGWATNATGAIAGLRLSTEPLDILQAALEAVAHRLAMVAEQIAPIVAPDAPVVASGGALAASPAWTQMMATALERPLHLTTEPELTARGAAILALNAVDGSPLEAFPPSVSAIIEPCAPHVPLFRAARVRQIALYNQIIHAKKAAT